MDKMCYLCNTVHIHTSLVFHQVVPLSGTLKLRRNIVTIEFKRAYNRSSDVVTFVNFPHLTLIILLPDEVQMNKPVSSFIYWQLRS